MLYVTTRVDQDAFTAFRALTENRGPEGGFFVPMQFPYFDEHEILKLAHRSFSQNIAEILNLFFGTQLDAWTIEFGIGRYPVKLDGLNTKITVAKAWHNPVYRFDRMVSGIEKVLRQSDQICKIPTDWMMLACRIAVLFAIHGELLRRGYLSITQKIDIAVPSKDLSPLMAVWYAKSMGLPIETIVCCCNENNSLWNLLHKGEFRTDSLACSTHTQDCDYTVPTDLERLIFATLGRDETARFCEICRVGGLYLLDSEQLDQLRNGIYVSVVSGKRMASSIPNLYKTTGHIADPYTALAYCGLTDYRAVTGANKQGLIISEESPLFSLQFIARCMNVSAEELKLKLD